MIKYKEKLKIKEVVFFNGDVIKIYFLDTTKTITTNKSGYNKICQLLGYTS